MINEQEYIFDTKLSLFCSSYGFVNENLIKLMLSNQEYLSNQIVMASDEDIKNKRVLSCEDLNAIICAYESYYIDIKNKIDILNNNEEILVKDLEKKVFSCQNFIKKLNKKTLKQIEKSTTMEALDKSPTDKLYF